MQELLNRGRRSRGSRWTAMLCVSAVLSLLAAGCGGDSPADTSTRAATTGAVPKNAAKVNSPGGSTPRTATHQKRPQANELSRSTAGNPQDKSRAKASKPPAEKRSAGADHVQGSSDQSGPTVQPPAETSQGRAGTHFQEEKERANSAPSSSQQGADRP